MTSVQTLYAVASADPDYAAFASQYSDLRQVSLPREVQTDLARETLALLEEMPDRAEQLRRIETSGRSQGMVSIPILLTVVFLLRTHLRIKRSPGGKWEFLVEQKPADTALIKQVLTRIAQLLPGA
jgi:hypothetical protein